MVDAKRSVAIDRSPDGSMGAYLASPPSPSKGGVLLVQEVFGVTVAIRDIADDLAAEGYDVLAPDLFWRLEPGAELGNGEDPVLRGRALDLLSRFDVEAGVHDLCAAADDLRARLPPGGRVAIVGFCIGGRMAALVASTGQVDAAVSFYGVGLDRYVDRLRSIAVPTEFFIGDRDAHIPGEVVEMLRRTIAESGNPAMRLTIFPDAGHAFYNRHRADNYQPQAAEAAKGALLAFLARHLDSDNAGS